MRIEHLVGYDLDPEVVSVWRKKYGEDLLPVQERAVKEFGVLRGQSLLVFAPTSSGKTFVGEMAALAMARRRRRVLFLVPLKALAEERYREFVRDYGPLGVRVGIATRDHEEHDAGILSGEREIGIVIYERLLGLLCAHPALLDEVGLVVADELQMLGDPERGAAIEMVLARVKGKRQLIGLSATLGEPEKVAEWLGAGVLVEGQRPVELRKGVFCQGVFRYEEHNAGREGREEWPDVPGGDMLAVARDRVVRHGEPTLVFLRDKETVERMARAFATSAGLPRAGEALAGLEALEDSLGKETLLGLLSSGVAVHHADLSFEERDCVERAFRSGEVKILFATSTLALGMNLGARNCFLDQRRWLTSLPSGGSRLADLTRAEFENMAGRAGRMGRVEGFGRAVLVASSAFEAGTLFRSYIQANFDPLLPALREADLGQASLSLLVQGVARSPGELFSLLEKTYSAGTWGPAWRESLGRSLAEAREAGLLSAEKAGVVPTGMGRVAARKGLSLDTALGFAAALSGDEGRRLSPVEALVRAALSRDGRAARIPLTFAERNGMHRARLLSLIHDQGEEGSPGLRNLFELSGAYELNVCAKKVLACLAWSGRQETRDVEAAFGVPAGALRRLGEEMAWLVSALALMARARGWPAPAWEEACAFAEALKRGVPREGRELARLRIRGLTRDFILRLLRQGYGSAGDLADADAEMLARWIPGPVAERVAERLAGLALRPGPSPVLPAPRRFVLDRSQKAFFYRGQEVSIQPQTFELLLRLAQRAGSYVPRRELYDALYSPEDPDFPFERQISEHKGKLVRALRRVAGREACGLVLMKRGVGYRLNAEPGEVSIV